MHLHRTAVISTQYRVVAFGLTHAALGVVFSSHHHAVLALARDLVLLLRWNPADRGFIFFGRAGGRGRPRKGAGPVSHNKQKRGEVKERRNTCTCENALLLITSRTTPLILPGTCVNYIVPTAVVHAQTQRVRYTTPAAGVHLLWTRPMISYDAANTDRQAIRTPNIAGSRISRTAIYIHCACW